MTDERDAQQAQQAQQAEDQQAENPEAASQQAASQQAGNQQAAGERARRGQAGSEPPQQPNVNQVRDEPLPASHHDGRPEPEEESPAPGARGGRG
jgi:hypothetical protein